MAPHGEKFYLGNISVILDSFVFFTPVYLPFKLPWPLSVSVEIPSNVFLQLERPVQSHYSHLVRACVCVCVLPCVERRDSSRSQASETDIFTSQEKGVISMPYVYNNRYLNDLVIHKVKEVHIDFQTAVNTIQIACGGCQWRKRQMHTHFSFTCSLDCKDQVKYSIVLYWVIYQHVALHRLDGLIHHLT